MKKFIAGLTFFSLLAIAGQGHCFEPAIDGVRVESGADIRVSFTVMNAFTKEIEEAIRSGVPTSFTFFMELARVKSHWFNEGVGKWQFRHTVKYDTLKEEYEITRDEADVVRTKEFGEMKKIMSTGSAVTLDYAAPAAAGQDYELKIKAELRTVKLPFLLNYMFFFVRYWDFETDWYAYNFRIK
ncbi:MAG: DUF4390 domain-containing protein [Deltaproteobacteria bacterium]|nr:DUF4390 domain-containing protein [Deltaproteobacteria bacterium]